MPVGRALGFSESFFHFMHGLGAYVIVIGARLRGPVREESVRHALTRAQERHPLLRVHVVEERGVLKFREEGTGAIPLRVGREAFEQAMEDELAHPIAGPRDPRLRALLSLGEGDAFDLILAMDHTVCDGPSLISILNDVLADLDGSPPAAPLPPLPSIEALLTAHGPIPRWTGKNEDQAVPLVPKKPPRGARRTRLLFRDLTVEETRRLAERCRAERTSVNGALTAAGLIAAQKEAKSSGAHLGVITNVGLRDKARPPVAIEHVGNFVSFVQTYHDVSPTTPFWDLARACRDVVASRVAAGEPQGRLAEGQLLWWQRGYLRHVAPRIRHGLANALAISNSGRLPIEAKRGAFTLEAVYGASSQHLIGSSIAIFVWSVPEALRVIIATVEPIVSKEAAGRVVDDVVRALRV